MPRSDPESYDWRAALGEVPYPEKFDPGVSRRAHPIRIALRSNARVRARACRVLEEVLVRAQGNLYNVAAILGCSWDTAGRFVRDAGLRERAGDLRLEHGQRGPTGHGVQRKPRRA